MDIRKIFLAVSLVAACAVLLAFGLSTRSSASVGATNVQPPSTSEVLAPPPVEVVEDSPALPPVDPRLAPLKDYILTAMNSWPHAVKQVPVAPYEDVAQDIAETVLEGDPAWDEDTTRARSAILLAGIGYFEGARYAQYVDDGSCNKWMWKARLAGSIHPNMAVLSPEERRLLAYGSCDGGFAYGLGQIHAMTWDADGKRVQLTPDLLSVRRENLRAMLMIARHSLRVTGGLCGYTGEMAWRGGCPKAVERLTFVKSYIAKHPYAPPPPAPEAKVEDTQVAAD